MDRYTKRLADGTIDFDCKKCPKHGNCYDAADCSDAKDSIIAKYEDILEHIKKAKSAEFQFKKMIHKEEKNNVC